MSMNPSSNVSQPLSNDICLADVEEIRQGVSNQDHLTYSLFEVEEEQIIRDDSYCGFTTVFIASHRKVIHKTWSYSPDSGSWNKEEELSVPDSIASEEELRHFVEMHEPGWLL